MNSTHSMIKAAIIGARPTSAGWYRVSCPLCLDTTGKMDRKGSLAVSARTGRYTCWKCQSRGRVDLDYTGEEPLEAPPPDPALLEEPEGFELLLEDGRWSQAYVLQPAIRYLRQRLPGRAKRLAADLGIGACVTGKQQGRLVVPIKDVQQRWLGWVGRDVTGQAKLKYVYPPGMTRVLFNAKALQEDHEFIYVVEGVFDALAVWPNVVACLGKPSKAQVQELETAQVPLVVALDGDAHDEAWALATRLRFQGLRAGAVQLPPAKDPATVPREWLLTEARRSLEDKGTWD